MTDGPKRHVIPEPYPETIGVSSMTIWVPEDFRGDAEIIWWYPGKTADTSGGIPARPPTRTSSG